MGVGRLGGAGPRRGIGTTALNGVCAKVSGMTLTTAQRVAAYDSVMQSNGTSYECSCCSGEIITALEAAGWTLVPPGSAVLIDPAGDAMEATP